VSGLIVAGLALGAVFLLRNDGSDETVSAAELRAATVLIVTDSGSGSGTIIDGEQGLILSNAHVARPDAPGQVLLYGEGEEGLPTSQREVEVYLSGADDETAKPTYLAEVVAADGYLDLAVLRITRTITGSIIDDDDLGLPDIPVGDSKSLEQGDTIQMIGYPSGVSGSLSPQADTATVAGFALDERIGDNRAWINSSVNISAGNSGGLAADDAGHLVGVPSAERFVDDDEVSRLRPIHLALPLIDAARSGDTYTSPWVTPADAEKITVTDLATPGDTFSTSCRNRIAGQVVDPSVLAVAFDYEGFPDGHQDVRVLVVSADGQLIGAVSSADAWPVEWGGEGCAVVSIPLETPLQPGSQVEVLFDVGPNYELLLPGTTITV
jgi:S1-C subfamily serine protease